MFITEHQGSFPSNILIMHALLFTLLTTIICHNYMDIPVLTMYFRLLIIPGSSNINRWLAVVELACDRLQCGDLRRNVIGKQSCVFTKHMIHLTFHMI